MSDIKAGDVVVCVAPAKCVYGAQLHQGVFIRPPDLTGQVRRVASYYQDEESGIGGFFVFTDGDEWCDGCCRKLNDSTDNQEIVTRIKSSRPIRERERVDG